MTISGRSGSALHMSPWDYVDQVEDQDLAKYTVYIYICICIYIYIYI